MTYPWLLTIPPHADVLHYSAEELRRAVIDAMRACETWTKGPSPSICPKLSLSLPSGPKVFTHSSRPPQLSPGGRFLAFVGSESWLQVIDLHNNGRIVWVYDTREDCVADGADVSIAKHQICVTKSGSLVLAYISRMEHDRQQFRYSRFLPSI